MINPSINLLGVLLSETLGERLDVLDKVESGKVEKVPEYLELEFIKKSEKIYGKD